MSNEIEKPSNHRFNLALGIIVTIYGVLATTVSYQNNSTQTIRQKMMFLGLQEMTRGNDAYSVADQTVNADLVALTEIGVLEATNGDPAAIAVWQNALSDFALDSVVRSDFLDDQYYEEVYLDAEDLYDNSDLAFETSDELTAIEAEYELIILLLAVGVAFSGWASLLDDALRLRIFFGIGAIIIQVASIILWLSVILTELPEEVFPL